ncbi:FecR family protein [Sphingobacterium sp. LRF_L2]|uniref:FecR family protein n=1 Tax=Sphingobacterium sp. LRF_L2 TaxID=3369421 RepID=UPI003F63B724
MHKKEAIVHLLEKYQSGRLSAEEKQLLERWYLASLKAQPFQIEEDTSFDTLRAEIWEAIMHNVHPNNPVVYVRPYRWLSAVASVVTTFFIAALGYWLFFLNNNAVYITKTAAVEEVKKVMLPDSSIVWLNAQSTIKYKKDFADGRNVILEGEGYFEVKKDPSSPFKIESGDIETQVLGTSFNIKAFPRERSVDVIVKSGKVKVGKRGEDRVYYLVANDHLSYQTSSQISVEKTAADDAVAWASGRLQFTEKNLKEIAAVLSRWYGKEIIIIGNNLDKCIYTAVFDQNVRLEEVLDIISSVNNLTVKYDKEGKRVQISGKGC